MGRERKRRKRTGQSVKERLRDLGKISSKSDKRETVGESYRQKERQDAAVS